MTASDDISKSETNEVLPESSAYEQRIEKDVHLAAEEGYAATDR